MSGPLPDGARDLHAVHDFVIGNRRALDGAGDDVVSVRMITQLLSKKSVSGEAKLSGIKSPPSAI